MSAKTTNRLTRTLDTMTPALVVLALASFALGFLCASQNLDTLGFATDTIAIALLLTVSARATSHDPTN